MTGTRRFQLTTAALLSAALTAMPAIAQVQSQNGGALDANQQVGSGGYNRSAQQVDYSARNLLITGNVGGGRAFRGSINYTDVGSFRGSLGSDSLFNFQRDSIYSAPGAVNYQAQGLGDRVIVTRATNTAPGYRSGYGGQALENRSTYDPKAGVLTFRQNGGGLVSISGLNDPTRLSSTNNSLGLVRTPQGLLSVDASPLTGIRYNTLDANTGLINPRLLTPSTLGDRPDPNDNPTEPETETDPTKPDPSVGASRRIDGKYTQTPIDNNLVIPEDPLAITLGTQVQSAMALQLAGRQDYNIPDAQAQSIRSQLFGPATTTSAQPAEAPKNPYDQIIADILAQAKDDEADPSGQDQDPAAQGDAPAWQTILEEPEQTMFDAKKRAREASLRISLGMFDSEGNIDYDQELPTIDPDSTLGKLMDELSYDLPRVKTLAGKDENRINTLLTRGEQELKAERYIFAENIYRQVLRETQGDPLAKAGLIHTQMGAGMIRSAAFNLRGLFSDHPELIALRYDVELMPQTERLRWLQGQLQKMIGEEIHGADPGLVLAYLGYQLEAKPLIELGLNEAETQAPRDPLMPVLRRIWLENEDAADAKDADAVEADKAEDAQK